MQPPTTRSMVSSGRLTARTNSALRRSRRRALPSVGLRRRAPSSRWYRIASVTTCTRRPAACTRQQKSTSSRKNRRSGSKPPSRSHTSRRTSMPAEPTASTPRLWSCWPWSTSPGSMPVTRRPARSMETPTSRRVRRSWPSSTLGPRTTTERSLLAARSSFSSAFGAGSQSSCSSQIHSTRLRPGSVIPDRRRVACRSATATASPYPVERLMPKTASWPISSASTAPLRSRLAVSTPTICSTW